MDPFFTWVEASWLSAAIRETNSVFAFPALVVLHTLGMALLVGINVAIALRILGYARFVPLGAMHPLLRIAWIGFSINAFSGLMLLIAYPTKAFTNPVFYFKLLLIGAATALVIALQREILLPEDVHSRRLKKLAAASLLLWSGVIAAGRLLAYTYTRLLVDFKGGF